MTPLALSLVVASGALHAAWNLFAKQSRSKAAFLCLAQAVAIAAFAPLAWLEAGRIDWSGASAMFALGSMALHGVYVWLLAKAYSLGDLSYVYPLVRGIGPLLVPFAGVLLLGESLSSHDAAGIGLIVLGIAIMGPYRVKPGGMNGNGIVREGVSNGTDGAAAKSRPGFPQARGTNAKTFFVASAVGVTVALYTVFDKAALDVGGLEPITLNVLGNIGNVLALSAAAFRGKETATEWRLHKTRIVLGGLFASGGYTLFLYALQVAPVAQLAPMREIGTVFGTLFGIFLLREAQGGRRIAASAIITAGVIALGL